MGPSETVGEAMSSLILDHKLNYFDRTSVFPLSAKDKADPDIMRKVKGFESVMEQAFSRKYAAHMTFKINEDFIPTDDDFPFQMIDELDEQTPDMTASSLFGPEPEDEVESPASSPDSLPDVDDLELDYNGYISAKV
jgi:hypothetical protein